MSETLFSKVTDIHYMIPEDRTKSTQWCSTGRHFTTSTQALNNNCSKLNYSKKKRKALRKHSISLRWEISIVHSQMNQHQQQDQQMRYMGFFIFKVKLMSLLSHYWISWHKCVWASHIIKRLEVVFICNSLALRCFRNFTHEINGNACC